jgi:ADP-ribose pyrophosphatase YjhB (NUDIX family)
MKGHVRPIALAVIKRERPPGPQNAEQAILVFEGHDPHKDEVFYRPLGGTIEFGERSEQTVRRELHEEVGLELQNVHYLATVENIFVYRGRTGHEIVMLYSARLANDSSQAYEQDEFQGVEDNGQPFTARWMPLSRFGPHGPPLYPTGLLALLQGARREGSRKP